MKFNKFENTKKVPVFILLIVLAALVVWTAVATLVGLLTFGKTFNFLTALVHGFTDYRVWVIFLCVAAGVGVVFAVRAMQSGKRVLKVNDLENAHWLSLKEINDSKTMRLVPYDKLGEAKDGMPIFVDKLNGKFSVVLANPIHTLVIGTTGSGKTTTFVDPVIQVLARTKTQPSFIITDPKGEICFNHAETLKSLGYTVIVLDLADAYSSDCWNPFTEDIQRTREIQSLMRRKFNSHGVIDVVQKRGKYFDYNNEAHLTCEEAVQANSAAEYVINGISYESQQKYETARLARIQTLKDEVFLSLQDIVFSMCPVASQSDPTWEQGAQGFILGVLMAMWEDFRDEKITEKQFCINSLWKTITTYAKSGDDTLVNYLERDRASDSLAPGLAMSVLASQESEKTFASYISQVQMYMRNYTDSGIRRVTSETNIDPSTFDDKPTACFVKIPDEKKNRHFLAKLFVMQANKALVGKARRNKANGVTDDEQLKRNLYEIMDEFGNMPKFDDIKGTVAVCRSRHIYLCPVIQNFEQLVSIYGKEDGQTLKDNCNITVYIATTALDTVKEISERCGKTKKRRVSFSDASTSSGSFSVSTSAEALPLVTPEQLLEWNRPPDKMGNSLVMQLGTPPLDSKYLPVFQATELYGQLPGVKPTHDPELFLERQYWYDIGSKAAADAGFDEAKDEQNDLFNKFAATARTQEKEGDGASDDIQEQAEKTKATFNNRLKSLRRRLPKQLGNMLDWGFAMNDRDRLDEALTKAVDYGKANFDRWIVADAVTLKNIVAQLFPKPSDPTQEEADDEQEIA